MAIKYLDAKRVRGSTTATKTVPDFSETFSSTGHTSDDTTVNGWYASDISVMKYDASNDNMYFNITGGVEIMYYDLQQAGGLGADANSTNWRLRFKVNMTTKSGSTQNGTQFTAGLVSATTNTSRDFIGVMFLQSHSSAGNRVINGSVNGNYPQNQGTSSNYLGGSSQTIELTSGTDWWVEITRDGNDCITTIYEDEYTGTSYTKTNTISGIADLRYLHFGAYSSEATFVGTIDNIELHDGGLTQDDKTVISIAGVDGSWSAGGALASDVTEPASGGNSSDAIVMGGYAGSNSGISTTQEYNGTAWSAGGNLQAPGGSTCGGGNSSDAIIMTGKHNGSNISAFCQEYNGTAWSDGGNPANDRHNAAGDGNSSDAICVGGSPSQSETYNGSSWTNISEVSGRENFAAGGSSTSAICFGATVTTETWDGSSWTAGGNMTQANGGNEGGGTPTDAITTGGTTDNDMVEKYNGTAWAQVDLLSTGRGNHAGKGNNLNAFVAGGGSTSTEERTSTPNVIPATYLPENTIYEEIDTRKVYFLQSQEWVEAAYVGAYQAIACGGAAANESPYNTTLLSSGAAGGSWTTGANMPDSIWNFGSGMGDDGRSTFMIFGGHNASSGDSGELDDSYTFNGTAWSSNIGMPHKHNGCTNGGGSSAGALAAGGRQGGQQNHVSKYGGSSWSSTGTMNINVMNTGGDGTNSDFLRVGGRGSGNTQNPTYDQNSVESYNGSSWSSETAIGSAIAYHAYFGNSSDGISVGGAYNYTKTDDVTTYNGSSWSTSASDLPIATSMIAGGTNTTLSSTNCMVWGGKPASGTDPTDKTYFYNGTAWTEKNALTYGAQGMAGGVKGL